MKLLRGIVHHVVPLRESALVLLIVLLIGWCLYITRWDDGHFGAWAEQLLEQSRHWVIVGMLAVPMTLIIATGGIDLSVASMTALTAVLLGVAWSDWESNVWLATGGALLAGLLCGTINGWLSGRARLAPLVVTLATMAAYRGLATGITQARAVSSVPGALEALGQGYWWGLPTQLWLWMAWVAVGLIVLHKTWVGQAVVALGDNPRAARYAALPVDGLLITLYAASGLTAGAAAIVYVGQYAGANADIAPGLELEVIACVILGGTRITGGNASILGSTLGVLALGLLEYNLELIEFPTKYHPVVLGCLVIVAAVVNEGLERHSRSHVP